MIMIGGGRRARKGSRLTGLQTTPHPGEGSFPPRLPRNYGKWSCGVNKKGGSNFVFQRKLLGDGDADGGG